jgi:hypothetical protein
LIPRPMTLPNSLITLLAADGPRFAWFRVAVGSIFVVERVVTVWSAGRKARLLALPLVIEIGYDLILQAVYVKSLFDIANGRKAGWNYVPRGAFPAKAVPQRHSWQGSCFPRASCTRVGSKPSQPSSRSTPSSTQPWR